MYPSIVCILKGITYTSYFTEYLFSTPFAQITNDNNVDSMLISWHSAMSATAQALSRNYVNSTKHVFQPTADSAAGNTQSSTNKSNVAVTVDCCLLR